MTENIILKTCTKCKIEQPTTNFWRRKYSKDGLQRLCKVCSSEDTRQRAAKKFPPPEPSLPDEIWRPVIGFETEYSISNLGRLRREKRNRGTYPGKISKAPHDKNGYRFAMLRHRQHYLHRLVAQAFLEPDPSRPHVNHKNGIRDDNHIDNLEWVTHAENIRHAARRGSYSKKRGKSAPPNRYKGKPLLANAKLTEDDVKQIREDAKNGMRQVDIARKHGVHQSTITRIVNRVRRVYVE